MTAAAGLAVVFLFAILLPVAQPMYYVILPDEDVFYDTFPQPQEVQKRSPGSMTIPLSLRFGKRRYGLPVRFPIARPTAAVSNDPISKDEWLRLMFGKNPVHGYGAEEVHLFHAGRK